MRFHGRRMIAIATALVLGMLAVGQTVIAQEVNQIQLTEAQVKGFISAQKDLAAIAGKLQEAGEKPDPALEAELEGIAKKHGFKNFEELDDVAANVSIVMAGLDPQTGEFTDPQEALKKELADIQADTTIPAEEKKQLVEELNEAITTTPPLKHAANIELIKKHRAAIEAALQ
ncbi:MAG: hypothetical protein JNM89_04185 [Hyphomicrobiaceae bacterium]|nr:hypothetical protein [Hyphomicrobiaceae bacterium]